MIAADSLAPAAVRREARRLGFDLCRFAAIDEASHADFFAAWLEAGRAGEMHYLVRSADDRRQPARLSGPDGPPLRTIIVLGLSYHSRDLPPAVRDDPSRGLIAAYAWSDDYHELIRPRLHALDQAIRAQSGRTAFGRALVDSGPLIERDWAMTAGLGFTGKNCCTIHPEFGSWLLLSALLVPETIPPDPPPAALEPWPVSAQTVLSGLPAKSRCGAWRLEAAASPVTCGRCTRCLAACPTAAFVGPFHLDPARCIAYWTVEAKGPIPRALRPLFANRIFGCDICQEVCPWNRRLGLPSDSIHRPLPLESSSPPPRPPVQELEPRDERLAPPLLEGFQPQTPYWIEPAAFAERFRRSAVRRARRRGMLRNVCVALGNWAAPAAVPALALAVHDAEPLVRGHAAWALGEVWAQHAHSAARDALAAALAAEMDGWVRQELWHALERR